MRLDLGEGKYDYKIHLVGIGPNNKIAGWSEPPSVPGGVCRNEFLENLRMYNQAINMHVLDYRTGEIVEPPFVGQGRRHTKNGPST